MTGRGESPAHEPAVPARSEVSPDVVRSFRSQLTAGKDVVDLMTWAGNQDHEFFGYRQSI